MKIKKVFVNSSIVCVVLAALIGIALLFKLFDMNNIIGSILLTILTIFVSSIFLLTSADLLNKKKPYGILSISLIGLSALLFLFMIWYTIPTGNQLASWFLRLTVTISALSLLFNLIFGFAVSLGIYLIVLQVLCNLCFLFIEIILVLLAFDVNCFKNDLFSTVVASVAIIFVVLYIILKIKGKNSKDKKDMVTIPKEEYEGLLKKISELESLLNNK